MPIPPNKLKTLLHMSHEYQCVVTFHTLVYKIQLAFPTSLQQWNEFQGLVVGVLSVCYDKGIEMILLDTMTACNLHLCHPVIYYLICHWYTTVILYWTFEHRLKELETNKGCNNGDMTRLMLQNQMLCPVATVDHVVLRLGALSKGP